MRCKTSYNNNNNNNNNMCIYMYIYIYIYIYIVNCNYFILKVRKKVIVTKNSNSFYTQFQSVIIYINSFHYVFFRHICCYFKQCILQYIKLILIKSILYFSHILICVYVNKSGGSKQLASLRQ